MDFIRSTEQSGDNRHSLPESVQFATRKNKPGHVTPRSNDVPPRKPFSSFLCLFFVSRIFFVPSLFFPHLNTPFKDPRGKKLYFVYTRHERYYKRENVFLCGEFYGVPFFCIIEHAEEIEIENLKNLYYKKKKVTLLEGTKKIHHFDEFRAQVIFTVSNYGEGMQLWKYMFVENKHA